VQAAFDRRPTDIEAGLDVEDGALLCESVELPGISLPALVTL